MKTFNPAFSNQKLEITKVEPYSYFSYAMLRTQGLDGLMDLLRYDHAFLCREQDVKGLLSLIQAGEVYKPCQLLLCQYNWSSSGRWTYAKLLSTQKLTEFSSGVDLRRVAPEFLDRLHIKPKVKYRNIIDVKGDIPYLFKLMFENKAMPATEDDAHAIERGFCNPDWEMTARLKTFQAVEHEWRGT